MRRKRIKWKASPDEFFRSLDDLMNGNSEEAKQYRGEMKEIDDEVRRSMIQKYKFNKRQYNDAFSDDIEDDEEYDDIY